MATDTRELLSVLQHIHTYTWTLQSDDSRQFAFEVAQAASRGLISTAVVPGGTVFGRVWKITEVGLATLADGADTIKEHEEGAYLNKGDGQ